MPFSMSCCLFVAFYKLYYNEKSHEQCPAIACGNGAGDRSADRGGKAERGRGAGGAAQGGDRNRYFIVDKCNTGLMDLFLTQARKAYVLEQGARTSVRESLNKNAGQQTNADRPKPKKAQER